MKLFLAIMATCFLSTQVFASLQNSQVKNLCSSSSLDPICKSKIKLSFKLSTDEQIKATPTMITFLSETSSATSASKSGKYTIEATPQYSQLSSKKGVYLKLRLFINDRLVSEPEIFSVLGEQADLKITASPKFVGFQTLELSANTELVR